MTLSNGPNERVLEPELALNPELQIDHVPDDVGGFEYGLQVGFAYPRVHALEVFEERLDQVQYPSLVCARSFGSSTHTVREDFLISLQETLRMYNIGKIGVSAWHSETAKKQDMNWSSPNCSVLKLSAMGITGTYRVRSVLRTTMLVRTCTPTSEQPPYSTSNKGRYPGTMV